MSVYMTEMEQLEAIKKWWSRYNNIITIVLSVVLLSISGYKYWHWHQDKIKQQASMAYEQLMLSSSNQDSRALRSYAHQLVTDYGQTIYADVARLSLAKFYVLREKYKKAETELDFVATHSQMMSLRQIAKIRLARVLAATGAYDKALAELNQMDGSIYMSVVSELQGDIYASIGKYQDAIAFYRKASGEDNKNGMGNLLLEMKTNELAVMTQSMEGSSLSHLALEKQKEE